MYRIELQALPPGARSGGGGSNGHALVLHGGALQTLEGTNRTLVPLSELLSLLHKLVGDSHTGSLPHGSPGGILLQGSNTNARLHLYAALLSYLQQCATLSRNLQNCRTFGNLHNGDGRGCLYGDPLDFGIRNPRIVEPLIK